MRRETTYLLTALLGLATIAAGEEPRPVRESHARNAILVSIDSTRADHLPFYGYPRLTTPALVRLAERRGVLVYTRASAVSPACHPSHVAMLTGLYPHQVGIPYCGEDVLTADSIDPLEEPETTGKSKPPTLSQQKISAIVNGLTIPEETETLPAFLRRQGLRTGGFVSIWTIHSRFGYARGFDRFVDEMPEYYGPPAMRWILRGLYSSQLRQTGEATVDAVLAYLQSLKPQERFFFFVHFADTHTPYAPRSDPGFTETPEERARLWETWRSRYSDAIWPKAEKLLQRKDGRAVFDDYDGSIRYVDTQLGRLFDALEKAGRLDETAVFIAADHGDSFGQHFYLSDAQQGKLFFHHSSYVWEETQHVPLLAYLPGLKPGVERRDVNASLVDLVPSVLTRLGFDPATFGSGGPGRDLLTLDEEPRTVYFLTFGRGRPGWMGKARPDRPKFIGLRRGDTKFFVDRDRFRNPDRGRCFLYDLAKDPNEKENLCDLSRSEEARLYRERLVEWYTKAVEGRKVPAAGGNR